MALPFFALKKGKWTKPLAYKTETVSIEIVATAKGVATIYDKEILLYIASLTCVDVVGGGSPDHSAAVIRELAAAHPGRVETSILPRNGGASNARNVDASLCHLPWIAFLDSDNVLLPGAACALLAGAQATHAKVIVGQFARVEGDAAPRQPECGWDSHAIRAALATGA